MRYGPYDPSQFEWWVFLALGLVLIAVISGALAWLAMQRRPKEPEFDFEALKAKEGDRG